MIKEMERKWRTDRKEEKVKNSTMITIFSSFIHQFLPRKKTNLKGFITIT